MTQDITLEVETEKKGATVGSDHNQAKLEESVSTNSRGSSMDAVVDPEKAFIRSNNSKVKNNE